MIIKIYPENPNSREIQKVVDTLKSGGLIIYPTDTVYGIACDMKSIKAIEKLIRLKGKKSEAAELSIICDNLSSLSKYTKPITNRYFKIIKHNTPGPVTFLFEANNEVPKIFKTNKKTIGIRVPDNSICQSIVKELGNPLVSSSLTIDDDILEYVTDPELMHEKYAKGVDIVIDGGVGDIVPSTIVDLRYDEPEIIREGKADILL